MTKASAPAPSCPRVRALPRCAVVLCALLTLGPSPGPPPAAAGLSAELESLVATSVDPAGPGVAVGIVRRGVLVFEGYRGLADLTGSVPITAATRFDLASVSKQFTAMSILVLRREGALNLEDDVATYLPELVPDRAIRSPRLADLLAMRSGLPDYLEVVEAYELLRRWRNETVLTVIAQLPRTRPPGLRTVYSNTNYALLALIAERLSGRPFADLVRSALFEPLGMGHSVVLDTPGQHIPNRAHGYDASSPWAAPSECDTAVVGDGQVFTTVRDLAIWDAALRRGDLVGPAATALLFTPSPLDSGEPSDYAMGYYLSAPAGHRLAEHGGGWCGTSTWIGRYLDDELAVIVLSNDESFDARALGMQLAATALGDPRVEVE